ncbi:trace amine-associated receptor 7e-like [Megalops cyprinoides]|uniref:trace amine-associated receptor 7e-like n=1 Tax=Megalops cyprinoides TaxID=118141 RepID=UPI001863A141|nr:trace amine-associated receptor 7e-like [Megalops cyprinoides]
MSATALVLLTVCGNLLVIISICHFKQLHTPTNLLLLSLAVADLQVGVLVMPFYFSSLVDYHWYFDAVYCTIYIVASFHLTCVSVYSIALIAVDRYFSLCNPFLYATKITVSGTLKTISSVWLYSLTYNVILLYVNGNFSDTTENATYVGGCDAVISEAFTVADCTLIFLIPSSTMIILYLRIFAIAKKHANTIRCARAQHHSKDRRKMNYSMASNRKAAKILGILLSVFILCISPYYICLFLSVHLKTMILNHMALYMLILLFANSAINPIIYALFYPWFQKCVKLIVTLKICSPESSLKNVL